MRGFFSRCRSSLTSCSQRVCFCVLCFFISYVAFPNIQPIVDVVVVVVIIIFIVTVERVTNFDKKITVTAPKNHHTAQVCRKHTTQPVTTYRGCAFCLYTYVIVVLLLLLHTCYYECKLQSRNCSTYYTQNIRTIHILFTHMFMFVAV